MRDPRNQTHLAVRHPITELIGIALPIAGSLQQQASRLLPMGLSQTYGGRDMRNNSIILSAAAVLALAAMLAIKPASTGRTSDTSAAKSTFDIIDLTRKAGDLPEESYPAH
jgi:hypothetical protein